MPPEQNCDINNFDNENIIQLYREHWQELYNIAFNVLKDKAACEDILQDIFVNIWHKRHQLEIHQSIKGYLIASVRYEVFRKLRREKKFEPIAIEMAGLHPENTTEEWLNYKEALVQIAGKVQELPEKCREVFILSRTEHLSHREISSRLSISVKTVRNHLTRALRQLRVDLTKLIILFLIQLFY